MTLIKYTAHLVCNLLNQKNFEVKINILKHPNIFCVLVCVCVYITVVRSAVTPVWMNCFLRNNSAENNHGYEVFKKTSDCMCIKVCVSESYLQNELCVENASCIQVVV